MKIDNIIYSIGITKVINAREFNRYLKFIEYFGKSVKPKELYTEKHHILPKAHDLFPQYSNLKKHKWNCSYLTARAHFIAHIMLAKAFSGSQCYAIIQMINKKDPHGHRTNIKINSRIHEKLKLIWIDAISTSKKGLIMIQIDDKLICVSNDLIDKLKSDGIVFSKAKIGNRAYGYYCNSAGDILAVKHGENIPDGFKHINSGKAGYINKDGVRLQLSIDDERILSGEFVAISKDRQCKDTAKLALSKLNRNTINIVFDDGSKMRVQKDDPILFERSDYTLNHGKGIKRKSNVNYKSAAKRRPSKECPHCGKNVKINLFERWHNDNCKQRPQ
jgi:hypothetical protein